MHNFDKTLPQERRRGGASHRIYVLATRPCVNIGNCAGNLAKRWLRPTALFLGTLTAAVLVASLSGTSVRVFTILSLAKIVFKCPPPSGLVCEFPSPWQFCGSYSLFRGSQNFDRTELFGAVTCMTGMVGCGGATTTVTQQIVPTVQVLFVAVCRLRVSFEELYEHFRAVYVCRARFNGTPAMVLQDL